MPDRIFLQDFKSFGSASLPLAPLSLLVGANASGKSNLLEALRLLNWIAQGNKWSSLAYVMSENAQFMRGRQEDMLREGADSFVLGCEAGGQPYGRLRLRLGLGEEGLRFLSESLSSTEDDKPLYITRPPLLRNSSDIQVEYKALFQGKTLWLTCSDRQAIFTQLQNSSLFPEHLPEDRKQVQEQARGIEQLLGRMLFMDALPQKMRGYSFKSDKMLRGDGSNLSAVLYDLFHDPEEGEAHRAQVLAFIRSLPEQHIEQIAFLEGPRGDVMLQLIETFGERQRPCDAALLSDGTLRVLAIAAALLAAPEGSLLVVEEVDNGIHPSRARQLLADMNRIARSRHLNLILSTHNPALLDALPEEALPDVVFCYRDPQTGFSKLEVLGALADYPELTLQGPLGDLLSSGAIDRFVKHRPSPQEKQEKALRWIQSLST